MPSVHVDPAPSRDAGFTLPELLISILILATIMTAISAAVIVVLRNRPSVDARAADARSYQGLITWLPRDAVSTPPDGVKVSPSTVTCDGAAGGGGSNLLELIWGTDDGAGPVTYIASYRFEPVDGGSAVRRYTCSSDGSFTDTESINLTSALSSTPLPTVTVEADVITMGFKTLDSGTGSETIEVQAAIGDPLESLPTTTAPAQHPPPTPCDVRFTPDTYGPEPLLIEPPEQADKLSRSVPITLEVTGDTCGAITIRYDTGTTGAPIVQEVAVLDTVGTVDIPAGTPDPATPTWDPTSTPHTIEALDEDFVVGTATLTVIKLAPPP